MGMGMAKGLPLPWLFLSSSLTIAFFLTLALAQQQPLSYFCSDTSGNFTRNSTYETSLNTLLSSFSLNASHENGFYNFSSGQGSNTANAIALCRGDVNAADCFRCINNANAELRNRCPNQREAIIWYDTCMFRYAARSILGLEENREGSPSYIRSNTNNVVTDVDAFNQALDSLLESLTDTASSGKTSLGKFATGSRRVTDSQTVYALVQCTPDLTPVSCRSCLTQSIIYIPQCCDRKQGARVYATSCNFRFEIARFYNLTAADTDTPSAPSPPPSNNTTTTGNKSDSSRRTIIVSISAVAFALLVISICIFNMLRLRKPKSIPQSEATEAVDGIKIAKSLQYDFDTVRAATDNFSDANKVGQGGFGAVYKGTLAGGKLIAVKRLSTDSGQGDHFGMARMCAVDQTQGATSRIVGTYGYMAPEYAMQGQFSGKSDVFSFGVLVLEILSGQKSSGFHNGSNIEDLLSFAWRNWKAGTAFDLVDPSLRDGPRTELMRCIHIGLLCVQENSRKTGCPLPSCIQDSKVQRFEFTSFCHLLYCLHLFARQHQRKGKTQEGKAMPKNKGKGGKNRKRGKNEADDEKRELVFKEDGQEYAQVLRMLGNGRCEAMCIDGTKRLCHIRGKMHKKVWIAAGDIILVGLRDYQDDKADVILKYMPDEARLLKAYGELPDNTRLNEGIVDEEDDGGADDYVEFEDEDIDKI
ncbi:hypothetical protein V6N11_006555 [Hibiscus sabdariffa]|uniref:Eukaryotic translation initiation factor 4C n=2 Tax=Hibiscus sabdariffa TaxID=183260 RepID=A0ABR2RR59_9ROSI